MLSSCPSANKSSSKSWKLSVQKHMMNILKEPLSLNKTLMLNIQTIKIKCFKISKETKDMEETTIIGEEMDQAMMTTIKSMEVDSMMGSS